MALGAAVVLALTGLFAAGCDRGETPQHPDSGSEQGKETEDEGEGGNVDERVLRVLPEGFKYGTQQSNHTVTYTDSEGKEISLYGRIWAPKSRGRFPAVIMSHGFNGHYTDFANEAKAFAERGYVCYGFDFCGAQADGLSTGRSSDEYTPFTMKEDLRAAIADIMTLETVDGTQIFLLGGSQGGLVTALTAADEDIKDTISAVAMYFPALNIPDDWRGKPEITSYPFPGFSISGTYIHSVQALDPYAVIGAYKKDVCIVWGNQDPIVRKEYIDKAVTTYGADRVELTVIDGAGHGFGGQAATTATRTVLSFLEARTYQVK